MLYYRCKLLAIIMMWHSSATWSVTTSCPQTPGRATRVYKKAGLWAVSLSPKHCAGPQRWWGVNLQLLELPGHEWTHPSRGDGPCKKRGGAKAALPIANMTPGLSHRKVQPQPYRNRVKLQGWSDRAWVLTWGCSTESCPDPSLDGKDSGSLLTCMAPVAAMTAATMEAVALASARFGCSHSCYWWQHPSKLYQILSFELSDSNLLVRLHVGARQKLQVHHAHSIPWFCSLSKISRPTQGWIDDSSIICLTALPRSELLCEVCNSPFFSSVWERGIVLAILWTPQSFVNS